MTLLDGPGPDALSMTVETTAVIESDEARPGSRTLFGHSAVGQTSSMRSGRS